MKVVIAIVAAGALMLGGLMYAADWAFINVHEKQEGIRIWVPVPLTVAKLALRLVPMDEIEIPEIAQFEGSAKRLARELLAVPDADLVEVHENDEHVLIRKQGDFLIIDVRSADEEVRVRAPIAPVEDVVEVLTGGPFHPAELLLALGNLPSGRLVQVRSPDADVTITTW